MQLAHGEMQMSPGRRRNAHNVSDVDPASFGAQLRKYREDAGLSQEDVAQRVGISQARVSLYENNRHVPTEEIIVALADAVGVPPSALFEASRFGNVLIVGPVIRERLRDMSPDELRMWEQIMEAVGKVTPEQRAMFAQGFANFLKNQAS